MKKETMTVDEMYKELKADIADLRNDLKDEISKMRTLLISLFISVIVIIGTLVGFYANMTIALLK